MQAKTATKEDIRDNLFFEFAEEKLPIIKMERESLSLEDVFLKLTGQDVEEVESEAKKASEPVSYTHLDVYKRQEQHPMR